MKTSPIAISDAAEPLSPADGTPAWLRFALFGTLFMLVTLWLEPHLAPFCRATAVQVGALLCLAGFAPQVQGDLITLSGFTVRIVTECTPLYACLLYGAFVLAQPASCRRTLAGLFAGVLIISAVNLLRISLVTAAGSGVSAFMFDVLHVYLGQVVMLMLVVALALIWRRWGAVAPSPFQSMFVLRAGYLASLFFLPWVAVNRLYVALLDSLVAAIFSLLYPGYLLLTPRPFPIYNHTFAVPLFLALMLAELRPWSWRRVAGIMGGISMIACWHALFRGSHVVWTALDLPEIMPLHQGIYLLGQYLLPFLLWLLLGRRSARQGKAPQVLALQISQVVEE